MLLETCEKKALDPLISLKDYLYEDLQGVDQIIDHYLKSSVTLIPALAQHLIYAGGKRLRPLLTLACYRLFKNGDNAAMGLAAAVEFIHTATLLHDDVIDESKLRRGHPTANELWGNQASILVGDFLFARSFQLMIETNHPQVLKILSNASARISEGEILQLSVCHNLKAKTEELLEVTEAKTAILFAAACEVGALLASHEIHAAALQEFGQNLGMTFQIIDDILDYTAQTAQLGKQTGDDLREGKITLPIILTYPQCQPHEQQLFEKIFVNRRQTPEDFTRVLEVLYKYSGLKQAYGFANHYGEKARQALFPIPSHPLKDILIGLVDYCLKRQY